MQFPHLMPSWAGNREQHWRQLQASASEMQLSEATGLEITEIRFKIYEKYIFPDLRNAIVSACEMRPVILRKPQQKGKKNT